MKKLYLHYEGCAKSSLPSYTFAYSLDKDITLNHLLDRFLDSYNKNYSQTQLTRSMVTKIEGSAGKVSLNSSLAELIEEESDYTISIQQVCNTRPVSTTDAVEIEKQPPTEPPDHIWNQVLSFMQEKRFKSARSLINTLIEPVYGKCFYSACFLGDIHKYNERYDLAKECYREALSHASDSSSSFIIGLSRKGQCHMSLSETQAAIQCFNQALSSINPIKNSSKDLLPIPTKTQIQVYKAKALYHSSRQEAFHVLTNVLKVDENNEDALMLYSKAVFDQGNLDDAIQTALKVLVSTPTNKVVKKELVRYLKSENGLEVLQSILKPELQSASAYAFLGTIAKDFGEILMATQLMRIAVETSKNPSYVLNLAHIHELSEDYALAIDLISQYCSHNSEMSVCGEVSNLEFRSAMDSIAIPACKTLRWDTKLKCAVDPDHATAFTTLTPKKELGEKDLDLLALYFTAVKILFLMGSLHGLPTLVLLLEPVRLFRDLHKTSIRNEAAYYSCIAQLLCIKGLGKSSPSNCLYVCGDSHTLATAWRSIEVNGVRNTLLPSLVTGLKHWHLRPESSFYPKQNFYKVVEHIPKGSNVIFLFGEIDCREGIILAIERCRYETLESGIKHTIKQFMLALDGIISKKEFNVFIHPVVPVLDETRSIVCLYNKIFKKLVEKSPYMWLDFFESLLTSDGCQLPEELKLDGTHLHPQYLKHLQRAFEKFETF